MRTEYDNLFDSLIVAPLRRVVGRPLVAVNYYILWCDWSRFDPETPNECGGCQGVHLVFGSGEVEFDWGCQHAFRDAADFISFHLTVSDRSVRREAVRDGTADDSSGLSLVPATDTRLWRGLVGEPLLRVEVLGERVDEGCYSPQAACLHFPSGLIVVAIGMTGQGDPPVDVGNGDEILVFDEQTWMALPHQGLSGFGPLTPCWEWPK